MWLKSIVLLPFLPLLLCWLIIAILYHLDKLFVHLLTVNTSQVFASSPDVCGFCALCFVTGPSSSGRIWLAACFVVFDVRVLCLSLSLCVCAPSLLCG